MGKFFFRFLTGSILLLFFILHNIATSGNQFYFTIDQGKDSVIAREIFEKHRVVKRGPATSVEGIHTGFLWPYFLSLGYSAFNGHPYGGVFLMALLDVAILAILMWWIGKRIGKFPALVTTISLIFLWRFFETSLWQFNPFPLLLLSLILVILLTEFFLSKKQKYYFLGLITVLLGFHAEVAAATSILIFYLLIGIYAVIKNRLNKKLLAITSLFPILASVIFLKELISVFGKTQSIYSGQATGLGTFATTNFGGMAQQYLTILTEVSFPKNQAIAIIIWAIVTFVFVRRLKKNAYTKIFVTLVSLLFVVSYVFFGSNRGWRDWHTLYLYPLLFSSLILMLFSLPRKIGIFIFAIIFISQLSVFQKRFSLYPHPPEDASILRNELAVIDWIYTHSENNGFNLYTYTNTFYDYHYQYLFWWYGKGKYKYVPCEYSNYPKSPKHTYVANYLDYSQPTLGCDHLRFLIIESDTNAQTNKDWINNFRADTFLKEEVTIGQIKIEKRSTTP